MKSWFGLPRICAVVFTNSASLFAGANGCSFEARSFRPGWDWLGAFWLRRWYQWFGPHSTANFFCVSAVRASCVTWMLGWNSGMDVVVLTETARTVWHGYSDNFDVFEIVPRDHHKEYVGVPARLVSHTRARYTARGVSKCWGCPPKTLEQKYMSCRFAKGVVSLTLFTMSRKSSSQKWVHIVARRWMRAMQYRGEWMMTFDGIWPGQTGREQLTCQACLRKNCYVPWCCSPSWGVIFVYPAVAWSLHQMPASSKNQWSGVNVLPKGSLCSADLQTCPGHHIMWWSGAYDSLWQCWEQLSMFAMHLNINTDELARPVVEDAWSDGALVRQRCPQRIRYRPGNHAAVPQGSLGGDYRSGKVLECTKSVVQVSKSCGWDVTVTRVHGASDSVRHEWTLQLCGQERFVWSLCCKLVGVVGIGPLGLCSRLDQKCPLLWPRSLRSSRSGWDNTKASLVCAKKNAPKEKRSLCGTGGWGRARRANHRGRDKLLDTRLSWNLIWGLGDGCGRKRCGGRHAHHLRTRFSHLIGTQAANNVLTKCRSSPRVLNFCCSSCYCSGDVYPEPSTLRAHWQIGIRRTVTLAWCTIMPPRPQQILQSWHNGENGARNLETSLIRECVLARLINIGRQSESFLSDWQITG